MTPGPELPPFPELPPERGFLRAGRGLPDRLHPEGAPVWNWRRLPRRAGLLGFPILLYILDRTLSSMEAPEWAEIPVRDFSAITGESERAVLGALKKMADVGLIERDGRGAYRPRPENFESAPLRPRRRHLCKPIEVRVAAPEPLAALRVNPDSPLAAAASAVHLDAPLAVHLDSPLPVTGLIQIQPQAAVHLDSPQAPTDSPRAPTDSPQAPAAVPPDAPAAASSCPLGWGCPYIPEQLPEPKTQDVREEAPACGPSWAELARTLRQDLAARPIARMVGLPASTDDLWRQVAGVLERRIEGFAAWADARARVDRIHRPRLLLIWAEKFAAMRKENEESEAECERQAYIEHARDVARWLVECRGALRKPMMRETATAALAAIEAAL